MDESTVRKEIIHFTRRQMVRQGTRRLSMDMIARELHISKRTIYIVFNDKKGLIDACVHEMKKEFTKEVEDYLSWSSTSSSQKLNWLVHKYLHCLYSVDYSFLLDMRQTREFSEYYNEFQTFWQQNILKILREYCPATMVNVDVIIKNLLEIASNLRVEGISFLEQENFFDVMFRGITG
ncbi:TetR/AcrR family transcriptional regulator [Bacteroides sp. 519]|uniref:TetR/AcrR family transcriptional regulator n=1 Tax=Bacteroides sp. 519 TaxID=2302937 RepID=UPI0013D6E755|nr:TetR/AcrR family transcriptional regulator [Bacteroides sp. 519]